MTKVSSPVKKVTIPPMSRKNRSAVCKRPRVVVEKTFGEQYVAAMRGSLRSNVVHTLFDPDRVVDDSALCVPSLSGSELRIRYTSNGSPLLHEKFR
jgi:hypothetical protein